jgi:4-hydroxybenzoate polyprenyltransferase
METESTIYSSFDAFAEFLGIIYKTTRLPSTLGFTSAALTGTIFAGSPIDLRTVARAAFGFAVNDLSDAEFDRSAGVIRNPVSTNELNRGKSIFLALFLLLVSVVALPPLSQRNQLLGLVVVFLYLTYSWLVRAKARPILDVVYHGLYLAILAVMGFTARAKWLN